VKSNDFFARYNRERLSERRDLRFHYPADRWLSGLDEGKKKKRTRANSIQRRWKSRRASASRFSLIPTSL